METISSIPKEEIPGLRFSLKEVLKTKEEIIRRKLDLERAMVLGNLEHIKTRIVFEAWEGLMAVETTVWATTDNYVNLKGGVCIPLRSICKVSF